MKSKQKISSLVVFIVILIALLVFIGESATASAKTLIVDPGGAGNYTEIQDAIDSANSGDTIMVNAGTYTENLKLELELNIWSDSRNPEDTIIKPADQDENVVEIKADSVTFSGFGIQGSEKAGIYLEDADGCFIYNNKILDSEYGIYLENSNRSVLSSNILSLNEIGIRLEASETNTIRTNIIAYNYGYGISLADSADNLIYDNYFKNNANVEENTDNQENSWSIALNSKKNIIRGPYIAGNFWANLEGTGYSETGKDENENGLCDTPYVADWGGTDNSPLYLTVPEAITTIEGKLDKTAYEEGLSSRGGEELEMETPEGGEGEVEETETEVYSEGREEEKSENETSAGANGSSGPGIVIALLAAGAVYLIMKKR